MRCWGEKWKRAHHHSPWPFRRTFPSPSGSGDLTPHHPSTPSPPPGLHLGPVSLRLHNTVPIRKALLRGAEAQCPGEWEATFLQPFAVCTPCALPPRSWQQGYSHFTGEDTEARSAGTQSSRNSALGRDRLSQEHRALDSSPVDSA